MAKEPTLEEVLGKCQVHHWYVTMSVFKGAGRESDSFCSASIMEQRESADFRIIASDQRVGSDLLKVLTDVYEMALDHVIRSDEGVL